MRCTQLDNGNTLYFDIQSSTLAVFAGFDFLEIVSGSGFTDLSDEWSENNYDEYVKAQIEKNGSDECDIIDYIDVLMIMLDDFQIINYREFVTLLNIIKNQFSK